MSPTSSLLVLGLSIVLIVVMISRLRIHPFLALLAASLVVGLGTGMQPTAIIGAFEKGMGSTLGFLAGIIGLGSILGKLLEESGGARRIATTLLGWCGERHAHWAMMLIGFIAGIPVFFEVGFVLLVPLLYVVARQTKVSMLYLGVPLALSLMVVHCMLPPHPAATAITGLLGADIGRVILYGLIVGIPTAIIAGPLWVRLACERAPSPAQQQFLDSCSQTDADAGPMPGFATTLSVVLLPLVVMVGKTFIAAQLEQGSALREWLSFIGNPLVAITLSVLWAYWQLGLRRGKSMAQLLTLTQRSFTPLAGILLIIGAGGAFNDMLVGSGIGKVLADLLSQTQLNPIILAWLVAGLMHFAVGSATVAMISTAGMVLPMLGQSPEYNRAIMVVAIGAGAIGWTHVTDSAFWIVKEYLGLSLAEALKKFTAATVLASCVALLATLLLARFV
ncbi:GntP family permease [Pseudomonas sichuanensis]|uniref:GntT/GntP/DsdX family permease n=1 Tax=Pseudomonas sichuanensis TaxID=2213015 RepID=UPI0024476E75|nr:gluconate:H+ symporter [Pseudomonas sichuanensis]MDH0734133.1 GntP family permease [Pseudomonas sichuanensis]MDH1586158.1 GntP family permease [Pseudomonas sichuanensis]MDH1595847.1 GntP family permease [Pseudomonas sichuanensis]MDH1601079.1 GntP family permease [Pseudomonas sichuanensis]